MHQILGGTSYGSSGRTSVTGTVADPCQIPERFEIARLDDGQQVVGDMRAPAGVDLGERCNALAREDAGMLPTVMFETDQFHIVRAMSIRSLNTP